MIIVLFNIRYIFEVSNKIFQHTRTLMERRIKMIKKGKLAVIWVLGAVLILGMSPFFDVCRADTNEPLVNEVVAQWITAWNNHDKEAVLALFAEDAGIAKGKEKKLLSKEQYSKEISQRMKENKKVVITESPKVTMSGENAEVVAPMRFPSLGCGADVVFKIRKYEAGWKIYQFSTTNLKKM